MFRAFEDRRPWASALTTFLFSPLIGMLYLNRGVLAVVYLAIEFGVAGVCYFIAVRNEAGPDVFLSYLGWGNVAINAIGAAHAMAIARRRSPFESLRWYSRWYVWIAVFVSFPAVALIFRSYIFQPFYTPSASMSPTLNLGDYFFVKKFAYDLSPPQRGDLVVFSFDGRQFVKRIAGVPGDRIQMRDGRLFVDGKPLPIRRIEDYSLECGGAKCEAKQYVETTTNGHSYRIIDLIVSGLEDNSAIFVVPPFHYFMIGDNRDNSMDSRNDLGFVPAQQIAGKVSLKFIDGRTKKWTWKTVD